MSTASVSPGEIINILRKCEPDLSRWEQHFLAGIGQKLARKDRISKRQNACLYRIFLEKADATWKNGEVDLEPERLTKPIESEGIFCEACDVRLSRFEAKPLMWQCETIYVCADCYYQTKERLNQGLPPNNAE